MNTSEAIIDKLALILIELDARDSNSNCAIKALFSKSWDE